MSNYYCQGVFKPKNPKKYNGTFPIVYRSRPELMLMQWFDIKDAILEWSSESIIIPYIKPTDGRLHKYYLDFSCKFINKDGQVTRYIIEYKPFKQTQMPVKTKNKKERTYLVEQMTYAINQAKWNAAEQFAKHNGMNFMIITERNMPQP